MKYLELLLRHRGMLTGRQKVEMSGNVVYTLDSTDELDSEPGDELGELPVPHANGARPQ